MRFRLRTLLLLVAVLPPLLAAMVYELGLFWELSQIGPPRKPPRMYEQHAGIAVVLACVIVIFIISALQHDTLREKRGSAVKRD